MLSKLLIILGFCLTLYACSSTNRNSVHSETVDAINRSCAPNGGADYYWELSNSIGKPVIMEGRCKNGVSVRLPVRGP